MLSVLKTTAVTPMSVDKAPKDLSKDGLVSLLYISVCVCMCSICMFEHVCVECPDLVDEADSLN